jgi:hypothetical protein
MYHTHPYYKRLFFKNAKQAKAKPVFANAEEKQAYYAKKYNFAQFARKTRSLSMIDLIYELPTNVIIPTSTKKPRKTHFNRQLVVQMSKILMDFFGMVFRDITAKEIVSTSPNKVFAIEYADKELEKELKGFKRESFLQNNGKIFLPSFTYRKDYIANKKDKTQVINKIHKIDKRKVSIERKVFAVPFNYQYQRLLQTQKYYTKITIA